VYNYYDSRACGYKRSGILFWLDGMVWYGLDGNDGNTLFTFILSLHIILFLHLLSTNHKCTQPCYFPLLLKLAAQKEKMDWNSSIRSSRLCVAPVAIPVELWSLLLFHFCLRVIIVFRDTIYVIIILYSWHLVICEHFWSVCVEQLILGHTYDEYLVLA
jgi:hypothetical protein